MGRWVVPWPGRALLLTAACVVVVLGGDAQTSSAWIWLLLAGAGPALRGRPRVAVLSTAGLTATAATVLSAAGEPLEVIAPATAAVLFVGALAAGLADSLRDVEGGLRALRSRERRFSALLRDAADVILVLNRRGDVTFLSPAVTRVLGYREDRELGHDRLALAHPDDRAIMLAMAARVRAMPGVAVSGELRVRHADGHHVWIEARVVDLTADPDVAGIVVAFHDISARKDAASEERLRISRDLHDSVSQGLFSMALQARAAQLELERSGVSEHAAVRRAIGDVADLARGALAEIRALIFELRPHALAEEGFVNAVRKHAAAVSSRHRVTIDVTAPAERIFVDERIEEHLFRVIQEAVGNAARHADAGRIDVDIATVGHPAWVAVSVRDDGRGFDAEGDFGGHFGLKTMRERIAVLGGELELASVPGNGTVVSVAVPLDAERDAISRSA